jgi:uncharacterized membrane protein YqjE
MALLRSVAQLGSTSVLVLRQRLELAALDVEEELLRLGSVLVRAFAATLLAALALAALAAAATIYFWEHGRLAVLAFFTLAFAASAWALARGAAQALGTKPGQLAATLAELQRDAEALRPQEPQ